jgi:hypothetical protein
MICNLPPFASDTLLHEISWTYVFRRELQFLRRKKCRIELVCIKFVRILLYIMEKAQENAQEVPSKL